MNERARTGSEHERTVLAGPLHVARPVPVTLSADPLLGAELAGTYVIERVLGEGGMGQLYEATHLRLGRKFAIKLIHAPLAAREDVRARFEREARVMSRVRSDHVVDVVDVVAAPDGRTCIVTELLVGEDLEQHTLRSGGRLGTSEAVELVRQALRGVRAAHALGVVHRDLKPPNLFLARDGAGDVTLKVLDFGVAKLGGDAELTGTGAIIGTPAYMAPEQARGAALADVRSDLYAIGAVLYRLVTGQSPYSGSDANGTLIQLMEQSPPRPSVIERGIPAGLEAVIEKAMARDPAERFQSVDELDAALAPFSGAGASTLRSHTTGSLEDPALLGRRARLMRPLAVLTAALLALGAGAAAAASLSLLVSGLSGQSGISKTELVLVIIGAAMAMVATAIGAGRALHGAWRNSAMVQARRKQFARALIAGSSALGALELCAVLWLALEGGTGRSPFWAAARVLAALSVATWVALAGTKKTR